MKRVKEAAESLEWARSGPAVNAEPRSFPGTRPTIDYSVSCREGLGTMFCSLVDVIVVFDRCFK